MNQYVDQNKKCLILI